MTLADMLAKLPPLPPGPPLIVAAATARCFEDWRRAAGMPRSEVRRVWLEEHLHGIDGARPVILVNWQEHGRRFRACLDYRAASGCVTPRKLNFTDSREIAGDGALIVIQALLDDRRIVLR